MNTAQTYDSREEWRHFDFAHIAAPAAWRTVSALETIGIVVFDLDRYEAVLRLLRKHVALADDNRIREVLRRSDLVGQVARFVRIPAAVADALETCEEPDPSAIVASVRKAAASAYLLGGDAVIDVDEPVPNYVVWRGGVFGIDLCDRPDMFVESAREGQRLLERLFSLGKCDGYHVVPLWARVLVEVLAASGVYPTDALYRIRHDEALQTSVRAAISLGGYVGLQDYLRGEGFIP